MNTNHDSMSYKFNNFILTNLGGRGLRSKTDLISATYKHLGSFFSNTKTVFGAIFSWARRTCMTYTQDMSYNLVMPLRGRHFLGLFLRKDPCFNKDNRESNHFFKIKVWQRSNERYQIGKIF